MPERLPIFDGVVVSPDSVPSIRRVVDGVPEETIFGLKVRVNPTIPPGVVAIEQGGRIVGWIRLDLGSKEPTR